MPTPDQLEVARQATDYISSQSAQWWMGALFLLFVSSGLYVLRMFMAYHARYIESLTSQLSDQRTANVTNQKELVDYIKGDHVKAMESQQNVAHALERVSDALTNFNIHMSKQSQPQSNPH